MTATPSNDPALLIADHGFVRSLAQQLCQDDDTADDIAQEAMVTALREAPTDGSKRRSWLASVTRHLVFNHSRAGRRRKAREQLAANQAQSPHGIGTSPAEIVAEEQLRSTVVAAVLKLPGVFREVVLLRYYRGLDTRECARQLDVPEATVRTRLKRGVDRLRIELDKQHGGDRKQWVTALLPFALETAPATIGARTVMLAAAALLLGTFVALPFWIEPDLPPPMNTTTKATLADGAMSHEAGGEPAGVKAEQEGPANSNRKERDLKIPKRFSGTVIDSKTRQALPGARISVTAVLPFEDGIPIASFGETATDEGGTFEFSLEPLSDVHPLTIQRLDFYYRVDAAGYRPIEDSFGTWQMKDDAVHHLEIELSPAAVTKGRVVDKEGNPIPYANLLVLSKEQSFRDRVEESGYFALDLPPKDLGTSEFTLIAFDDAHGFSQPVRIKADGVHETVVPDLRVSQRHGCIEGIVRDRNGRGVPDVSLRCVGGYSREPYDIHGVRIDEIGRLLGKRYVSTDEQGRFAFRALPPGKYEIRGPSNETVELAAFQTKHIAMETPAARIEILCEDLQGLPLEVDYQGVYVWRGDAAYRARTQFAKVGFAPELLATADSRNYDALLHIDPPAFAIVEAAWNGIGPMTGSCFLPADQFYGQIHLRTSDARATGSLKLEVTDALGAPIKQLVARACRVPGRQPVPIEFGTPVYDKGVTSAIYPDAKMQGKWWQWVPPDGILRGLPIGEVSFEIVADPEIVHRRVRGSANNLIFCTATIRPDATTKLAITATRGCLPEVDITVPELEEGEELGFLEVFVTFTRKSDGREFARKLRPRQGPGTLKLEAGRFRGRVSHAIPPGSYTARPQHFRIRHKDPRAQVDPAIRRYVISHRKDVELTENMPPIALELTLKVVETERRAPPPPRIRR